MGSNLPTEICHGSGHEAAPLEGESSLTTLHSTQISGITVQAFLR